MHEMQIVLTNQKNTIMKQKTQGTVAGYAPLRDEGSQIIIGYGLRQVSEDLYEWFEICLPKKQTAQLSIQVVKDAIIADINARTDEQIVAGFVWTPASGADPVPVWLSQENQFNFKSAYDLAVQKEGATLPVTFKMGEDAEGNPVYHTFEDMEDAEDFYVKAVAHINQKLADGWAEKDALDLTPYEQALADIQPAAPAEEESPKKTTRKK